MFEEEYVSEKLQKFSLIDIALVSLVYFVVGILVSTGYPALMKISGLFYIIITLIAVMPITLHLLTVEGSLLTKIQHYVKTNNPAYQILLFFTMFFLGCMIVSLAPILSCIPWYGYIALIMILAIKPMRSNLFW